MYIYIILYYIIYYIYIKYIIYIIYYIIYIHIKRIGWKSQALIAEGDAHIRP
jgi:hypothetical protein